MLKAIGIFFILWGFFEDEINLLLSFFSKEESIESEF